MSEKRLFNIDEVLECANLAIALQREVKKQCEELTRLKELNREMVGMIEGLAEHLENCYDREIEDTIKARELLTKAEGVGE